MKHKTTGQPVFITVVLHRRILYLKNLVGQVAPQALPDAYETTKFLFYLIESIPQVLRDCIHESMY